MRASSVMRLPEARRALEVVREKKERGERNLWHKYYNIRRYMELNLRRVYALGLDKRPPCSILDIGAGAGFFLYLCKLHGHTVMGFDIHDGSFYRNMHEALGVPCQCLGVSPATPLPDFGRKFDLITAFAICFHKLSDQSWSGEEWRFFCEDLLNRHCEADGRIHLHLNDSPRGDRRDVFKKITASFPSAVCRYHSADIFQRPQK